MFYNEAFEIMANYANEALPLFADRWSRWPDAHAANHIIRILEKKRNLYAGMDLPEIATQITAVAAELMFRAAMVESEYHQWVKQSASRGSGA